MAAPIALTSVTMSHPPQKTELTVSPHSVPAIVSSTFPELNLTVAKVLNAGR